MVMIQFANTHVKIQQHVINTTEAQQNYQFFHPEKVINNTIQ